MNITLRSSQFGVIASGKYVMIEILAGEIARDEAFYRRGGTPGYLADLKKRIQRGKQEMVRALALPDDFEEEFFQQEAGK